MKTWILASLLALPCLVASPGEARAEEQASRCAHFVLEETDHDRGQHPVTHRIVHTSDGVFALSVGPDDGPQETIEATAEHPFWARPGWTPAGELRPGDEIFTSSGGWIRVHGNTWIAREQLVYNLDVEGADTFFVGESGAWVHNTCYARHHIFPVADEFAGEWNRVGLNPGNYIAEIPEDVHHVIHGGGGPGGRWNQAWRDFFADNPGATREQIGDYGLEMWSNLEPYARYLGDWRPR